MKTYKELLEARKPETINNPDVWEYEDKNGKVPLGMVQLETAAYLNGFSVEDVLSAPGFYHGKMIKMKSKWSTLKGYVWIQIAGHSKFKK